jgi:hypothetical protein
MLPRSGLTIWLVSTDDLLQPKNSVATVNVKMIVRFFIVSKFMFNINISVVVVGSALIAANGLRLGVVADF